MKYVVAGGSGFLGQPLTRDLAAKGHQVVVLTRGRSHEQDGIRFVTWSGQPDNGAWQQEVDGADGVVNLAGAGIADKRWTTARKQELRQSRVDSTRALVSAVRAATVRPTVFLSGSAIGIYGPQPHDGPPLDESAPPGSDFLSSLGVDWEAEAHAVSSLGCRLVILRTGVVLARDGGALEQLIPPFNFFVGGPLGSGRQVMSWIHRRDWLELVVWLLRRDDATGVFNGTAPAPVTNKEFSKALGRALGRPAVFPVPGFVLTIIVGEMAGPALLAGQRVVPAHALTLGFTFQFPDIHSALSDAVASSQ
ncbi:MAG: TIGR01777 family oxidoreductase [Acidobacteria bacterium]|nr:TIGR01777 family oxidoreductase [Acidobacteriota bacterium]